VHRAGRKALLIPVLNLGYFAFPDDPPATRTEAYVREQVSSMVNATNLTTTIDDVSVPNIKNGYFEESPLFKVILPRTTSLACPMASTSIRASTRGTTCREALALGEHTIHFTGPTAGFRATSRTSSRLRAPKIRTAMATDATLSHRASRCYTPWLGGCARWP